MCWIKYREWRMFVMDYEMRFSRINSEINELLYGSEDTIYFDLEDNVFKIAYNGGSEVGMTLDRLIDIL